MQKALLNSTSLIVFLFVSSNLLAEKNWNAITSTNPQAAKVTLLSSDITSTSIKIELGGFYKNLVSTAKGDAYSISLENASPILEADAPDLPKITVPIVIPDAATMKAEVQYSSYVDITNIEIAPSKGSFTRDIDPLTIPYVYGEKYNQDAFYPTTQTQLRDPYILRDLRGQTLIAYPFQYNPVTKTLRVYTELAINVSKTEEKNSVNIFNRTKPFTKVDREYKEIYLNHFINAQTAVQSTPVEEDGNMLIICDASFLDAMAPLVDWKIRKGIPTEIVDVATIGNNAADLKIYIEDYYNNKGLKYVLLVGDNAEVSTYLINNGNDASDPSYGYISGNDSYAEVFVGRFSADKVEDVRTQVNKVLSYEEYPVTGLNWYHMGIGVGSDQGPGDDNEMDYEHIRNIRSKLMSFTYTDVSELYDGSEAGLDSTGNPDGTMLLNEFNKGVSIMNYTGHGSNTSWGTTGFGTAEVAKMTNYNMLPFIWSVACVNGNFASTSKPCLAEALLRSNNNGKPTGAIATLMSSINQNWNEPMEGQDDMNDILVESDSTNIKRTFGGISVNGCMTMNDVYGSTGCDMTDTWHIFGDPSIYVRTDNPVAMTVSHITTSPIGISSLVVNCNTEAAFIALTFNNSIIGTGVVSGGIATISFNTINTVDTIHVTATAFNKVPYMGDVILTTASTEINEIKNDSYKCYVDENNHLLNLQTNGVNINQFTIYNSLGQQMPISIQNFSFDKLSLHVNSLSSGVYLLQANTDNGIFKKKFFISNK